MGFFDLLEKAGLIEQDPNEKKVETTETEVKGNSGVVPKLGGSSATPTYVAPNSNNNEQDLSKFNDHFNDLFDKANLPGPDYYEFNKMCQAMATLSDDVKFPAVYGGLQVQGLDKKKLTESAAHYINIIDEDQKKFNGAIDAQILGEANKKKATILEKAKKLGEKEALIKQLQEEIANDTVEITKLNTEAADLERKANEKSTIYKNACDARKASITSDIAKINTYIK